MFETMQGFLCFFLPFAAAILVGILFESHLIAFEERIKTRFLARRRRKTCADRRASLTKISKPRASQKKTAA